LERTVTTLRDRLEETGRVAHEFRIVRLIADGDSDDDLYVVAAYLDRGVATGRSIFVIGTGSIRDGPALYTEVEDLNNYIIASRRLVGLDADVFARNGII
jgi:hypothetical protein